MKIGAHLRYVAALLMLSVCFGCTHISPYDQTSYQLSTAAKAEALSVIAKATEPYSQHQTEVAALELNVNKAYEYARGLPKNQIITHMWEILNSKDEHALGAFLQEWKDRGILDSGYIAQKQIEIGKDFDQIIELESGKNKTKSSG
jgi:hypothetical protein